MLPTWAKVAATLEDHHTVLLSHGRHDHHHDRRHDENHGHHQYQHTQPTLLQWPMLLLFRNHPWTPSNDQEYHNWRNSTSTSQYQCDWVAAGGGEGSPLTVIMGHYGTPTPALEATTVIFISINIIGNIYIKIFIDKNINIILITGHFRKRAPEHLHCHIYISPLHQLSRSAWLR